MLIEDYFQQIRDVIDNCQNLQSSQVSYIPRSVSRGFIRGDLYFTDSSILHLREFVDVRVAIERNMYSYQYMDTSNNLIFRYDNTEHHQKLNLPTYPHHKHLGSEDNVVASNVPSLTDVLKEISELIQ